MKNLVLILLVLAGAACSQQNLSPTETAKIVVESFYNKDNQKLKEYTNHENYESYLLIQNMIATKNYGKSNFKVLQEKVDGEIAWVKFTTSYEEKPETFKLVKENGQWKVVLKGLSEKGPF